MLQQLLHVPISCYRYNYVLEANGMLTVRALGRWPGQGQVVWDTGLQLYVLCCRPVSDRFWSQAQEIPYPFSVTLDELLKHPLPVSNWVT